jgi:hypothetical protein
MWCAADECHVEANNLSCLCVPHLYAGRALQRCESLQLWVRYNQIAQIEVAEQQKSYNASARLNAL